VEDGRVWWRMEEYGGGWKSMVEYGRVWWRMEEEDAQKKGATPVRFELTRLTADDG